MSNRPKMKREKKARSMKLLEEYFRNGIYVNPLSAQTESELMREAEHLYDNLDFKSQLDISELTLDQWKRGMLLAADPDTWLTNVGTTDDRNVMNQTSRDGGLSTARAPVSIDTVRRSVPDEAKTTTVEMIEVVATEGHAARNVPIATSSVSNSVKLPQQMNRSEIENQALKDEEDTGWRNLRHLTKETKFVLVTCAFGALAQGCAQESIIGANLKWPLALGIATQPVTGGPLEFEGNSLLKFSFTNGVTYLAASFSAVFLTDPISYKFGRRITLLLAGLFSLCGPIGAAYSQTWYQLLACRVLQGIGIGAKSSVIPVLESEVAPARLRGRVLVLWQTFVATGIAFGAATNWIFSEYWRLQIGISFVSAVPLLVCCLFVSESPYWLLKKGRHVEAFRTLRKLRPTTLQTARDYHNIYANLKTESSFLRRADVENYFEVAPAQEPGYFRRLLEIFRVSRNLNALLAAWSVMLAQQFSGINLFAFLATSVLESKETDPVSNLRFSFGFGCVNAVTSALAYFLIDRYGRRLLILSSLVLMFPFLFGTARHLNSLDRGGVEALILIYTLFYGPGAGVIPFMYSSEVFSIMYKEIGMSLAVAVNFGFAGLLGVGVPLLVYSSPSDGSATSSSTDPLSASTVLYIFGGLCLGAVCLVWIFMRTSGELRSLEEMNTVFVARWHHYIQYEWREGIVRRCKWPRRPKKPFDEWQEQRRMGSDQEEKRGA